jgi:hypothetical protein
MSQMVFSLDPPLAFQMAPPMTYKQTFVAIVTKLLFFMIKSELLCQSVRTQTFSRQ